jgi:formamidopyrimidine-DNA glycosylase
VPELPEVEAVRRELDPAMTGARFVDVDVRRPDLRAPFPRRFRARLVGQRVDALTRRAKYLLANVSSSETLVMHLGMSGSFRVEEAKENERDTRDPHDHVVFVMSSGAVVTFNDPRRFGIMELLSTRQLAIHPALSRLGPEPLSSDFNAASLARACRGKKTTIKAALLDQRTVAGLGNIYAVEALHVAGISPLRRASTIATPSGEPRDAADRLAAAIKQVLTRAIARTTSRRYRSAEFQVYDRERQPCLRPGCSGTIRRRVQTGRSTFYCAACQH